MANFAVIRDTRDGFVKDLDHPDHPLGSVDNWAGRGQVRVVFSPRNELLVSADYGRFDGVPLREAKPILAKPGPDSASTIQTVCGRFVRAIWHPDRTLRRALRRS